MSENIKKIAIYARVSTKEQAEEGYSIDAQIEACRNKYKGDKQIEVYADRGISGKSIEKREEMKRLLNDIKDGRIERVFIWKLNRLTRSLADTVRIIEDIQSHGVTLECIDQTIDLNTSAGLLNFRIMASVAEYERENIVDNVKMGMKARARQGEWNGGKMLGYDTQKVDDKKELIVNEQEGKIVCRIFSMYAKGNSYRGIASQLNEEGYVSKKNIAFSACAIKYILTNSVYIGEITFNARKNGKKEKGIKSKGKHTPIIGIELWDKVQKLIGEKQNKPSRASTGSALLTGLMKCPICGASLVIGSAKNKRKDGSIRCYRFYKCSQRTTKGTGMCAFNRCINADIVEQEVIGRLGELANSNSLLDDIIKKINEKTKLEVEPLELEKREIQKSKSKIKNKIEKVWELYEEGLIDKEIINDRVNELTDRLKCIERRLDEIRMELDFNIVGDSIDANKVREILEKIIQEINKKDNQVKKMIMQLVINIVELNEQGVIKNIQLKFNSEAEGGQRCSPSSIIINV